MNYAWTLTEDTKDYVYSSLRTKPSQPYQTRTCPRWLNKQLKFLMATTHQHLMKSVLSKVQNRLRSSDNKLAWAPILVGLLVLSMVTESMQVAVRCKEATDKREKNLALSDPIATNTIGEMEEKLDLTMVLFRKKWRATKERGMKCNPLSSAQARTGLKMPDQHLAQEVKSIIDQHRQYSLETGGNLCLNSVQVLSSSPVNGWTHQWWPPILKPHGWLLNSFFLIKSDLPFMFLV